MDEYYTKLKDYLQQRREHGEPVETTRATLIQHGWQASMVDQAIADLAPPAPSIQLPEPEAYQPLGTQVSVGHAQEPADTGTLAATQSHAISGNIPKPAAKYGVLRAAADAIVAIKRNPVPFLAASAAAILVSIGLAVLSDKVIYGIISLDILTSNVPSMAVFATILTTTLVSFLITMTSYSLIQFAGSYVIFESGEGRKPNLPQIAAEARSRILRLLFANFLVGLLAIGPIVFISNIFLLLKLAPLSASGAETTANALTLAIWIAVLAWLILVILRYALAPIAALFEPDIKLWHSLRRSRELLAGGGQWFIGKLLLIVLVAGIVLSAASGERVRALDSTDSTLVNGGLIVLEILINGTLVMLYRNRKMVKDTAA
jgi:hypothetical protein